MGWLVRLSLLGLAILSVAGCGSGVLAPNGPYATPSVSPGQAVIDAACKQLSSDDRRDLDFLSSLATRQGTQLQRVSDDLSNAVPGGNVDDDSKLVRDNAKALLDAITTSGLCAKLRSAIKDKAQMLLDADEALFTAAGGGGPVADALARAVSAYHQLQGAIPSS